MGTLDKAKESLFDVAIHYAHNMSSVNRLQQLGGQTPQGNKLIREVILPTWSTVDLRPKSENIKFFRLAIAQALGVKIGQKYQEQIDQELDDKLAKLSGTVKMLQDHLDGGEVPDNFVDKITSDFKVAGIKADDLTPAALHALQEYARWSDSGENAQANFKTALYVEADGVTNGVTNALNMFASSSFTASQVENMRRGGRFMDGTKTMNEFRQRGGTDLYSVGANNTESAIERLRRTEGEDSSISTQQNHVLNLLNSFGTGVTFIEDTGELSLDRGVTKNPMTITLYGSGAKGIAGNIANSLAESLYEKLSEAAQAMHEDKSLGMARAMWGGDKESANKQHAAFLQHLNGLISTKIAKQGAKLSVYSSGLDALKTIDPVKFEFDLEQMKAIQANILHTLVVPMRDGIDKTLGESLMDSIKLVQSATQAQSISLEHQYNQRVRERQAQRIEEDQNHHKEDGLSQNDLDSIMEELRETHPLIETEGMNFFPAHDSQSEMTGASASGLNGSEFLSNARVHGPSDAGVKGLSMLNQGMGDGSMIQRMMINGVKGLPVFDGFNLGLDQVASGSMKANQAAHEAWAGNPQRAVFQGVR
jgi:hypothetical protein